MRLSRRHAPILILAAALLVAAVGPWAAPLLIALPLVSLLERTPRSERGPPALLAV